MGLGCMDKLNGQVAIVTGAGRMRGIGRAAALALAREGASVVVAGTGRDPETFPEDERLVGWRDVDSVAQEIADMGRESLALVADVTSSGQVQAMDSGEQGSSHRIRLWIRRTPQGSSHRIRLWTPANPAGFVPSNMVDRTVERFRRVDLVNPDVGASAPRLAAWSQLEDLSEDAWRSVLDIKDA